MRTILIFILINCSLVVYSQPGIANLVEENGERFYQHKVEEGNTLWMLQKMYDIPAEVILSENPSLKEGLKVGQIVLIPVVEVENTRLVTYTVKKKETLYGLSVKFDISIDELISLNPELVDGLQKGQLINVPEDLLAEGGNQDLTTTVNPFVTDTTAVQSTKAVVDMSFSDSTIKHTVMAHETMYSISKRFMVTVSDLMKDNNLTSSSLYEGQILTITVKQERVEKVGFGVVSEMSGFEHEDSLVFNTKDEYRVAVLLPFNLDHTTGSSQYLSNLSAQFYMGASMALDSLQVQGLNARVYFFDTKNDSTTIAEVLSTKGFAEMDLIVGPLIARNMKMVANYCKEHEIRMVLPVSSDASILKGNRLVYSSVASTISLMNELALYLLNSSTNDNIVLIKPRDQKSMALYEAFRKTFVESDFEGSRPNLIETTIDGFGTYIKKGVNTRFIVPTLDQGTATRFMSNLNRLAFNSNTDEIFVYGTKEWLNFKEIKNTYKNTYNFHFVSSNMNDYYTELAVCANRTFRANYNTDMTKLSMQAYDVILYCCSSFFLEGKKQNLLMNAFNLKQVSVNDGYENAKIFLIEQEDFELIKSGESN
ncbi:MAG: LysM peptidoglycan-binding domain-containing protein [Crocinitomicaceae bacterium]|nr:LysM peptidoglycan-binding domain-containing protein [Crocinitomicaceae bacterium]MDG1775970.1 LysM peptidoglycan-binding domain-containing protein [Crocinitomicaceae bacterium]